MAVDEKLAQRVRDRLGTRKGLVEKRMFGGLAFLLKGNMCVGVHGQELIVRLDPGETQSALARPHTRIFDLSGGRPMQGWILVGPAGLKTEAMLDRWVHVGVDYASSLPRKETKGRGPGIDQTDGIRVREDRGLEDGKGQRQGRGDKAEAMGVEDAAGDV